MDGSTSKIESVNYMDVKLYKAAVDGEIEAFNDYKKDLGRLLTPNKNTVLHVHLANQRYKVKLVNLYFVYFRFPTRTLRSANFVEQLLNYCPSLLLQANDKGEIPLHIEARYGHCPTVILLLERAKLAQQEDLEKGIEAAKEMLRIRDNEEEDTPLHIAARYGHLEVVRELIKADPDFLYPANKNGETPLYIAARRGYYLLVGEILTKCKSVNLAGPEGSTALHAAVMANGKETTRRILEYEKLLAKETDNKGRSPLHLAAHLGYRSIVNQLLECDNSTAYIADFEDKMTALHMATRQCHISIMKDIIRHCPECCELVDERGWNFLHLAAVALNGFRLREFLGDALGIEYVTMANLLVQKDKQGYTPLQLLVKTRPILYGAGRMCKKDIMEFREENLAVKEESQVLKFLEEVGTGEVAGVRVHPLQNFKLANIAFEKAKDSHLVVATLIATVTFAAAVTMPGGFKNDTGADQGTAILIRNAAFNLFVIFDAIAFVFSLLAVLIHFLMARPQSLESFVPYRGAYMSTSFVPYSWAYISTLIAVGAMVIAFITGAFAVLQPSLWLAIATCFIGLTLFLLVFVPSSVAFVEVFHLFF